MCVTKLLNHVCSRVSSFFKRFSDDVKVCADFGLEADAMTLNTLQRHIVLFVKLSKSWGLKLIMIKCSVMTFSSKCCPLPVSGKSPYKVENNFIKFASMH